MISIEQYIAENSPRSAQGILAKYNIPAGQSIPDLTRKLRFALSKFGTQAAGDLAMIDTPYKQLIVSGSEKRSNACGCSGADGSEHSNCSDKPDCGCKDSETLVMTEEEDKSSTINDQVKNLSNKVSPYVPIITITVLGIVLIKMVMK